MYEDTKKIFDDLGMNIDPRSKLSRLTVSQRQLVDIVKSISYNCKIIVMDEPTSSLTDREVSYLFNIINQLKKNGVGIIYISHKLEEVFEIADDITVLRDGKLVTTSRIEDITMDQVVAFMVGRELTQRFPSKTNELGEVVLRVEDLAEDAQRSIRDISFELHSGEILGIAGLLGSGRTELLETIFGIRKKKSGGIYHKGKEILIKGPNDAIRIALRCTKAPVQRPIPSLSVALIQSL